MASTDTADTRPVPPTDPHRPTELIAAVVAALSILCLLALVIIVAREQMTSPAMAVADARSGADAGDQRQALEALLARDPHDATAVAELAALATAERRWREAAEQWGRLAKLDPLHPDARYEQARALLASGDTDAAKAVLGADAREPSGRYQVLLARAALLRGGQRLAGVYWFGSATRSTDDFAGLRLQRRLGDGPWRMILVTAVGDGDQRPEPALRRFVRDAPWLAGEPLAHLILAATAAVLLQRLRAPAGAASPLLGMALALALAAAAAAFASPLAGALRPGLLHAALALLLLSAVVMGFGARMAGHRAGGGCGLAGRAGAARHHPCGHRLVGRGGGGGALPGHGASVPGERRAGARCGLRPPAPGPGPLPAPSGARHTGALT